MNERIKQLERQAIIGVLKGNDPDRDVDRMYISAEFTKKFAELIVRECTEIALEQKKWVEDQKVHNPEDESWNKARIQQSQHIMNKIEQHFGVER